MKNYDVVALGELLVDFTQNGISAQGNWLMEANAGGAPCNVLAMLAKLGHSVSFVGKVGARSHESDWLSPERPQCRGLPAAPLPGNNTSHTARR